MAEITIKFPTPKTPDPIKDVGFIAQGLAAEGIIGVSGTCTPKADPAHPIQGTLLYYRLVTAGHQGPRYLWVIGFKLPPAAYDLNVVGYYANGKPTPPATVPLNAPRPKYFDLTTDWPQPEEDITQDLCGGTFLAQGQLTDGSELDPNSVQLIVDTDPQTTIPADSADGTTFYPFWFALFAPPTVPVNGTFSCQLEAATLDPIVCVTSGLTVTLPCS